MLDVKIENILPITEVKSSLEKLVSAVKDSDDLYVITTDGQPSAVLVGVHHLEVLTGVSHKELMPDEDDAASAVNKTEDLPTEKDNDAATMSADTTEPEPIDPIKLRDKVFQDAMNMPEEDTTPATATAAAPPTPFGATTSSPSSQSSATSSSTPPVSSAFSAFSAPSQSSPAPSANPFGPANSIPSSAAPTSSTPLSSTAATDDDRPSSAGTNPFATPTASQLDDNNDDITMNVSPASQTLGTSSGSTTATGTDDDDDTSLPANPASVANAAPASSNTPATAAGSNPNDSATANNNASGPVIYQ